MIYPGWEGFTLGKWSNDEVDVRDFIQRNYQPYEGDANFLVGHVYYTHLREHKTIING
ncbi:MAG: hypothetical protein K2G50_01345 [Anaeroplasmataceae bacterium]|nr:hypothetical protein [Anaeroplasmataceae bacterium]